MNHSGYRICPFCRGTCKPIIIVETDENYRIYRMYSLSKKEECPICNGKGVVSEKELKELDKKRIL